MEEKTDVPKLADVLDDARVKVCIGLEQQGHILTVEKMLAEGKTWEEIGEVIGWYGPTAEEWYGLYLKAREESQAPPDSPAQLSAREFYEKHWPHCVGYPDCDGDLEGMAHNPGCPLFQKGNKELFRLASRFSFAEAYRDASQRQPQSVSEPHNNLTP